MKDIKSNSIASSKTESAPFFGKSNPKSESSFFSTSVQAKLTVGQPDDPYEQEADRVSRQVVQGFDRAEGIQRSIAGLGIQTRIQPMPIGARISRRLQPALARAMQYLQTKCQDCEKEEQMQRMHIQREGEGQAVAPNVESQIQSMRGGGQSMDPVTQTAMESSFGADFSSVRVHTDSRAVQMSRDLNAHAFTVGSDVFFNEGRYRPHTREGAGLLAHELTHTVQQGAAVQTQRINRLPYADVLSNPAIGQLSSVSGEAAQQAALYRKEIAQFSRDMPEEEICQQQSILQRNPIDQISMKDNAQYLRRFSGGCGGGGTAPAAPCKPTLKSLKATAGGPPAMTDAWPGGACELALGVPANPGMSFSAEVDVPSGCTGTLEYLQLVDTCRQITDTSDVNTKLSSGGFVLDTQDPYAGKNKPVTSSGSVTFDNVTDSPGNGVGNNKHVKISDSFKIWLLWTPTGGSRVALGMVTWNWRAEATRNYVGVGCTNEWTVSGASHAGGVGAATSTMPTWSDNVTSLTFKPGTC